MCAWAHQSRTTVKAALIPLLDLRICSLWSQICFRGWLNSHRCCPPVSSALSKEFLEVSPIEAWCFSKVLLPVDGSGHREATRGRRPCKSDTSNRKRSWKICIINIKDWTNASYTLLRALCFTCHRHRNDLTGYAGVQETNRAYLCSNVAFRGPGFHRDLCVRSVTRLHKFLDNTVFAKCFCWLFATVIQKHVVSCNWFYIQ